MNQTFTLHRFLLLLRVEWAEKGRTMILMASLLTGLLFLFLLPIALARDYFFYFDLLQILALLVVGLAGSSLYTVQIFSRYGSRDAGMMALMLPASRLEKFLSALFLNLLFIVPFLLLFLFLHSWSVEHANAQLPKEASTFRKIPSIVIEYVIGLYILIQGVFSLGSLYFTKAAYLKTAIFFGVVCLVIVWLNYELVNFMTAYPAYLSAIPFGDWHVAYGRGEGQQYYTMQLPPSTRTFIYLFPFVVVLALWYITYTRLKEKEI